MRFTIRDWLWLTVVVGLVLAWWADRGQVIDRAMYQNANTKLSAHLRHREILLDRLDPHWRNFKGSFSTYTGNTPALPPDSN
jgi:hypothetical protein